MCGMEKFEILNTDGTVTRSAIPCSASDLAIVFLCFSFSECGLGSPEFSLSLESKLSTAWAPMVFVKDLWTHRKLNLCNIPQESAAGTSEVSAAHRLLSAV